MSLTTDPNHPGINKVKENGQNEAYIILSDEERAKGFIRPVRQKYVHVGKQRPIEGTIISLEEAWDGHSEDAKKYYSRENGWVAFHKYPEDRAPVIGSYIKQDELDAFNSRNEYSGGCGATTRMALELAETYARNPKFYGATYCVGCGTHLPVEEFKWAGTDETVGS